MSELLNFPNSQRYEALKDEEAETRHNIAAGRKAIDLLKVQSGNEDLRNDKLAVVVAEQSYQTIASEYCDDKEGLLTSDDIKINQDFPTPRSEVVEDAYITLCEAQLKLVEAEDKAEKSTKRTAAEQYADSLDQTALGMRVTHEKIKIHSALSHIFRGEDVREAKKELEKYGYDPDKEKQSDIFHLLLQEAKAIHYGVPTKKSRMDDVLGHKRAADYQETKLLLADETIGRQCRRAIRRAGFHKIPKSWDDEEFSTSDMAEICAIARKCEQ